MLRSTIAAAILVSLSLGSSTARAEPGERDRALAKLAEGARYFEARDYARALGKFEEAYAIVPSPKIFFNFAIAYAGLGRQAEAFGAFERFLREAADASPVNRAQARRELERLGRLVGFINVSADARGAEVVVDGKRVGMLPLGDPVPLDPGPHEILIRASGFAPESRRLVVVPGGNHELRFEVLRPVDPSAPDSQGEARSLAVATAASVTAPAQQRHSHSSRGWMRTGRWVALGASVAALSAGISFNLASLAKTEEFEKRAAPGAPAQPLCGRAQDGSIVGDHQCLDIARDQRRFRTWAIAGYATAGALAVTTVAFFLLSPKADSGLALRLDGDLSSGGVTYARTF